MSVLNGVSPLEDAVALFVAQLLIILILSRLIGILAAKFGQPRVIAEMVMILLIFTSEKVMWSHFGSKSVGVDP